MPIPHALMNSLLPVAGINKGHVEAMETRLKQDVLKEAQDYGNQIMVAHEDDDYQVVQKWEPVTEVDVQTPLDVYRELEGISCSNQEHASHMSKLLYTSVKS